MKRLLIYLSFWSLFLLPGCVEIPHYPNSAKGNFEVIWTILDENYCFFDYKEIDWDSIYREYAAQVTDDMDTEAFFKLMDKMLRNLKDGHVNLVSPFNVTRYWDWCENYPPNYHPDLIDNYLGTDYQAAGGFRYKVLDDNVGYLRYASFSSGFSEANLDYVLYEFSECEGMIIDVRENGGGTLSNCDQLVSRFIDREMIVGYMQHKTGKGHNDFSEMYPKKLQPSSRLRYNKPVVVLTNRTCYSATNEFVSFMRNSPYVTILGDQTGGGSGLPFTSEIPVGWTLRFSACPSYDADKNHIEFGIEPDIKVSLSIDDQANGIDTLIEAARSHILERN